MLLAIDTSAGTDVAIVTSGGRVLAQHRLADTRHHAEAVGVGIREALDEAGVQARHITSVVAGMGPGPFTGLRVGVAAARAFAFARRVPVIPVASHDAIAHEWRAAHLEYEGALAVTTDARRRELACSLYASGHLRAEGGFRLASPDDDFTLGGAAAHVDARQVSAAHLALAALEQLEAGLEPIRDEIVYLRAPDAVPATTIKRVTA